MVVLGKVFRPGFLAAIGHAGRKHYRWNTFFDKTKVIRPSENALFGKRVVANTKAHLGRGLFDGIDQR